MSTQPSAPAPRMTREQFFASHDSPTELDWIKYQREADAAGAPNPFTTEAQFFGSQAAPVPAPQHTRCAVCGEDKHTPLRVDRLGGYVCLTCIDKELSAPVPRTKHLLTQTKLADSATSASLRHNCATSELCEDLASLERAIIDNDDFTLIDGDNPITDAISALTNGARELHEWKSNYSQQAQEVHKWRGLCAEWEERFHESDNEGGKLAADLARLTAENERLRANQSVLDAGCCAAVKESGDLRAQLQAATAERDELGAWKKSALTVESWWAKIDEFVRKHPRARLGYSVAETALLWLKERDALDKEAGEMERYLQGMMFSISMSGQKKLTALLAARAARREGEKP